MDVDQSKISQELQRLLKEKRALSSTDLVKAEDDVTAKRQRVMPNLKQQVKHSIPTPEITQGKVVMKNNQPVVKGAWSPEEDAKMLEAVNAHGFEWKKVATFVFGRSAKQCRDRYKLKLDPSINHGPWTPEEDVMLGQLHEKLGRQWTKISKCMPGRTENAVKSRFASLHRMKTKTWTDEQDKLLRECKANGMTYEEIARDKMPQRSKHAIEKRWDHLHLRELAEKIRESLPCNASSGTTAVPQDVIETSHPLDSDVVKAKASVAAATLESRRSNVGRLRRRGRLAKSKPIRQDSMDSFASNSSSNTKSKNAYSSTEWIDVQGLPDVKQESIPPQLETDSGSGIHSMLSNLQSLSTGFIPAMTSSPMINTVGSVSPLISVGSDLNRSMSEPFSTTLKRSGSSTLTIESLSSLNVTTSAPPFESKREILQRKSLLNIVRNEMNNSNQVKNDAAGVKLDFASTDDNLFENHGFEDPNNILEKDIPADLKAFQRKKNPPPKYFRLQRQSTSVKILQAIIQEPLPTGGVA